MQDMQCAAHTAMMLHAVYDSTVLALLQTNPHTLSIRLAHYTTLGLIMHADKVQAHTHLTSRYNHNPHHRATSTACVLAIDGSASRAQCMSCCVAWPLRLCPAQLHKLHSPRVGRAQAQALAAVLTRLARQRLAATGATAPLTYLRGGACAKASAIAANTCTFVGAMPPRASYAPADVEYQITSTWLRGSATAWASQATPAKMQQRRRPTPVCNACSASKKLPHAPEGSFNTKDTDCGHLHS